MQLGKVKTSRGETRLAVVVGQGVRLLRTEETKGFRSLSDLLQADAPARLLQQFLDSEATMLPLQNFKFLAPVDEQEVWAAGVTYKRSQEARERESAGAARFYDLVYSAPRPELFFKATPRRVKGSGEPLRVRRDSRWSVPEPELALVISPRLQIVGYTIGNDMSARDIEGENPLYLPQAKIYDGSCALGPVITLAEAMPPPQEVTISLVIERSGEKVFEGSTSLDRMARSFDDLVQWLGRDNAFPDGVILLTGTGIVPPDDFSLAPGDVVSIDITGIGRLSNPVE